MMNFKNFSFALALATVSAAAVGCAATSVDDPTAGGDMGGDDGGSDTGTQTGSSGDPAPKALNATGTYLMASTFDISTNLPGTVGAVTNQFIAATDDPDDPTKWVCDLLIAQLSGTAKSIAQDAEDVAVGYLNDELLSIAPTFVTDILQVGQDFGDITKHFGLVSQLAVTGTPGNYTAVHTVTGVHFKIDNIESDYMFSDYGADNVVVPGVGVTIDTTGKFSVAQHAVPLTYGQVLHIGLDAAILPMIDPNATDLASFLQDEIDCNAVGEAVSDAIGIGSASMYAGACTAGLSAAANLIYAQIDKIDTSPLTFNMAGVAKAGSSNNDGKVDTIAVGKWDGTIGYAGTPAPMATATFTGTRM